MGLPWSGGHDECGIDIESSCEEVNPLQFALNLFKSRTETPLPNNLPFKPRTGLGLGAPSTLECLAGI